MKIKSILLTVTMMVSFSQFTYAQNQFPVQEFSTKSGEKVKITMIQHGSLAIEYQNYLIQIDPVSKVGQTVIDYSSFPKANVILITHEHGDHLSQSTIQSISNESTVLLLNNSSYNQIKTGKVISNGQQIELEKGVKVDAVPAYNSTLDRSNFHAKGNGNGYVLTIAGLKIYVSGDTEEIPEMSQLKDINVAFLSTNLPYTMTVEQCIKAARTIAPKVLIPYHFGTTDIQSIKTGLSNDSSIEVRLFDVLR